MAVRSVDKGISGEDLAVRFLTARGCTIVDRNVRVDADELDIVMRDGASLVAVEVKTSTNGDDPIEAVDDAKFARFTRAADAYASFIDRLDIVGVSIGSAGAEIRWLRAVG